MLKFIIKNILFLFNLVFILGLLLSYLAPYIDPRDFWPVGFFGLTYKAWLLSNLILIFCWLFLKRGLWIYNLLAILVGVQFLMRTIQFNSQDTSKSDFSVMAFNTLVQQVYNNGNTSEQINRYAIDHNHDIVVLIEWFNKQGMMNPSVYPYQQFVALKSAKNRNDYGMKIVSRYKIIHWERVFFDHNTNNMSAYFDIEIGEEIIRFIAVHLQSNRLGARDYHQFLDFDFDEESKNHARTVLSRIRESMLHRSIQVERIREVADNSPYPVMILGDFNDTPQSYSYEQLRSGRKDAYVERGSGWGATFMKPFPFLRIDYILYDESLQCTAYDVSDEIKSDHKIISANFKF